MVNMSDISDDHSQVGISTNVKACKLFGKLTDLPGKKNPFFRKKDSRHPAFPQRK